jgi:MATE family multidrug resistance protein
VGLLAVVLLTLCIVVFFKPLAACFTEDQEVVKLMWLILPSFIFYQLGDCTQIVFANALRGIEDTKPLAFIASFSYIVVCIPLCYVMSFVLDLGVSGVWMGIPIGLSLAGILFFIRFRRSMRALQNK